MVEVTHSGDKLSIDGTVVDLPDPVEQIINTGDSVIVLMDTLAKSNHSKNVWAFDLDGSHRWKIEEADQYDGDIHPYTNISFREGILRAHNWNGYTYHISTDTGQIEEKEFVG